MGKKDKRLLPGDFLRKIKYEKLDNTKKDIEKRPFKFFEFPEDLKGEQFKDRDFLVFYFDSKDDYEIVKEYFQLHESSTASHPKLDTGALVKLVQSVGSN